VAADVVLRLAVTLATVIAMCALTAWLVRRAKRGAGAGALGAVLMMFSWGSMRDPRNDTVAEAQDGRIRKDNESGDPPR
jgi:hypothetical protein